MGVCLVIATRWARSPKRRLSLGSADMWRRWLLPCPDQRAPVLISGLHASDSWEQVPVPGAALPCALGMSGPPDPVIVPFAASGVPVGGLPLGSLEPSSAQILCIIFLELPQPWSGLAAPGGACTLWAPASGPPLPWADITKSRSLWLPVPSPWPQEPRTVIPPLPVPPTLSQSTALNFGSITGSAF